MAAAETAALGQRVVDYFSRQPHDRWEHAETLEDVELGLQVVRVLIRMGRYEDACQAYQGDLSVALHVNLNAKAEILALLKPFFPDGWDHEAVRLSEANLDYLLYEVAIALPKSHPDQARNLHERSILRNLSRSRSSPVVADLMNLAELSFQSNRVAEADRLFSLGLEISDIEGLQDYNFVCKVAFVRLLIERGDSETDRIWRELDDMPRPQDRAVYRPGLLEWCRATDLFYRGELTEQVLVQTEKLAGAGHDRSTIQAIHRLRGEWRLTCKEPLSALESFAEAVRMLREVGEEAARYETPLALARLRAGICFDAHAEAERLSKTNGGSLAVAELWRALGERDAAVEHALRAHSWAVADGEPHVHRYYLDRTRALLTELGAPLPEVPRYDPSGAPRYPWEKDLRALIEQRRAERQSGTLSLQKEPRGAPRGSARPQKRPSRRTKTP
jgi:tetratricopeptide (TPR) repeat protein